MRRIIWAPSALEDIDAIAEYIARDSKDRASLFVSRIVETIERLQAFPLSGRVIPEIDNTSCREIIYQSYHVMYRIENDDIWITGVVHSARDWMHE